MLKIGLIGVGHLGKIHLRLLKEIATVQVIGFYDHDAEMAARVEHDFNVKFYPDADLLMSECDAVDIVTPTLSHFEYAIKALNKSRHIFIEKPLTNSVEEGKKVVALV